VCGQHSGPPHVRLGGCLAVIKRFFFQIAALPTVFFLILTKLGTHDPRANTEKCGTDFRNFDFKIFGKFKF